MAWPKRPGKARMRQAASAICIVRKYRWNRSQVGTGSGSSIDISFLAVCFDKAQSCLRERDLKEHLRLEATSRKQRSMLVLFHKGQLQVRLCNLCGSLQYQRAGTGCRMLVRHTTTWSNGLRLGSLDDEDWKMVKVHTNEHQHAGLDSMDAAFAMLTNTFGPTISSVQVQTTTFDGNTINISTGGEASLREKCLQSLSSSHSRLDSNVKSTAEETCGWFLEHPCFQQWHQHGGMLLLEGRAGSGKTTLMDFAASVEQQQGNGSMTVAYFFRRDVETMSGVEGGIIGFCRAVLIEILRQDQRCAETFMTETDFMNRLNDQIAWSRRDLVQQVKRQLSLCAENFAFRLFVDAIDECNQEDRQEILDILTAIWKHPEVKAGLCVSSRPYTTVFWPRAIVIYMERENLSDIQRYVNQEIAKNEVLFQGVDLGMLWKEIVSRAAGVFKWVILVMQRMKRLFADMQGECTTSDLIAALDDLPQELSEVYELMLRELSTSDKHLAVRIFRWLAFSTKPMTASDLRVAVAIEPYDHSRSMTRVHNTTHGTSNYQHFVKTLRRLSSGLLKITNHRPSVYHEDEKDWIQFDHETVLIYMRERGVSFLETDFALQYTNRPVPARFHDHLARCCFWYLNALDRQAYAEASHATNAPSSDAIYKHTPFLTIAWTECFIQAGLAELNGHPQTHLIDLTSWPDHSFCTQLASEGAPLVSTMPERRYRRATSSRSTTLLHLAAEHRLGSIVCQLIRHPQAQSAYGKAQQNKTTTPEEIIDCLQMSDPCGWSPLCYATINGDIDMVRVLIEAGVDINRTGTKHETPLHLAAAHGHVDVAGLLLREGGNPYSDFEHDGRAQDCVARPLPMPMHHAVQSGSYPVVAAFVHHGVDVNTVSLGNAVVHLATEKGDLQALRWLVTEMKADLNIANDTGETPVHIACRIGEYEDHESRPDIVTWLLSQPLRDVNSLTKGLFLETSHGPLSALDYACQTGDPNVVEALLKQPGILINQREERLAIGIGLAPLHLAATSERCDEAVRTLLCVHGLDVNVQDSNGCTALHRALPAGGLDDRHVSVVRQLLARTECDPDVRTTAGWPFAHVTPLFLAAGAMPYDLAFVATQLLLDTGKFNVNASGEHWGFRGKRCSVFESAVSMGNVLVARLLHGTGLVNISKEQYRRVREEVEEFSDDEADSMETEKSRMLTLLDELEGLDYGKLADQAANDAGNEK